MVPEYLELRDFRLFQVLIPGLVLDPPNFDELTPRGGCDDESVVGHINNVNGLVVVFAGTAMTSST